MNPVARDYPSNSSKPASAPSTASTRSCAGETSDFPVPVFPHARLAAQIARQAKVLGKDEEFAVVFAAMGITFEEADFFIQDFRRSGAIERSVLFMNLANDPAIERIATPRMAITCAEYLAYDLGMHVLVILTDITNYAEALRKFRLRGKRFRAGEVTPATCTRTSQLCMSVRAESRQGSITQIPILTMPEDDKTHRFPTSPVTLLKGRSFFPGNSI